MDHAGNFPVSNGGVQLESVFDLENPSQSHSQVPARTWDELVSGSAYPFDGVPSTGGKAKYDSSDPRL
jgi:hypothetical protein